MIHYLCEMDHRQDYIPLAERMRPTKLDEVIGQDHLIGPGKILSSCLEKGYCPSILFWGPPGVGKTTLAKIIAQTIDRPFYFLSAIQSGVKEVRAVIDKCMEGGQSVLFIDEIHRFNKSQQDALLGAVEQGLFILIGATTENPSFEVNAALLSRCQVYTLQSLNIEHLRRIILQAIQEDSILSQRHITIQEDDLLIRLSGGDARILLNTLEIVCEINNSKNLVINNDLVEKAVQKKMARYDKKGEQHYDIISAFIKSMRGSDPNASVYWLARMIEAGEDPEFIARRMLILASEDIGNANPTAMILANNCFDAVRKIGFPESRIILSQTAIYLACSNKSNSAYMAIEDAIALVRQTGDLEVPLHLRNAPTPLMKNMGYGKQYEYAHHHENNFITLDYLPKEIKGHKLYEPSMNIRENEMRSFLKTRWTDRYNY